MKLFVQCVVSGCLAILLFLLFPSSPSTQPAEVEAEFIRVQKRVEVREYDALGRHSGSHASWVEVLYHHSTHTCWISQPSVWAGNSWLPGAWTPAPTGVCK